MTIAWIVNPQATGARFGCLKPDELPALASWGYKPQTAFGPTTHFDPTVDGGEGLPDPKMWEAVYNGVTYGHPVALILNTLGIRKSDSTATATNFHNIATKWVPGDRSYEDRCITGYRDAFKQVTQPMLTRMWHEPATSDWTLAADYKQAWQKVVKFFRDTLPKSQCPLFVWCPNGHITSGSPDSQFWPGDAWVDWIGIDAYSKSGARYTGLQAWYDAYNPTSGAANPSKKPMMICEWGIADTSERLTVFNELTYLLQTKFTDIKALTYWKSQVTNPCGSGDIGLSDCPPGFQKAFSSWLASPYMNPSGSAPPPPPPPVQVAVPAIVGLDVSAARAAISAVGLVASGSASGTVDTQSPNAATLVDAGSTVTYTVAATPPPPSTPVFDHVKTHITKDGKQIGTALSTSTVAAEVAKWLTNNWQVLVA